ncbi:MAG: hypothetical protein ACHREM_08200 [Polyangiales bacterium]
MAGVIDIRTEVLRAIIADIPRGEFETFAVLSDPRCRAGHPTLAGVADGTFNQLVGKALRRDHLKLGIDFVEQTSRVARWRKR